MNFAIILAAGAGQSRTVKEIIQFTNKISMTGENK